MWVFFIKTCNFITLRPFECKQDYRGPLWLMASRLHKIQHKIRNQLLCGGLFPGFICLFLSLLFHPHERTLQMTTPCYKKAEHTTHEQTASRHTFFPVLSYWFLARRPILYDIFFFKKQKILLFFLFCFLVFWNLTLWKLCDFFSSPFSLGPSFFKELTWTAVHGGIQHLWSQRAWDTQKLFLLTRYFPPSFLGKALLPLIMINFSQGQESPSRTEPEIEIQSIRLQELEVKCLDFCGCCCLSFMSSKGTSGINRFSLCTNINWLWKKNIVLVWRVCAKTRSLFVVQSILKLVMLLPQTSGCWDYRCVPNPGLNEFLNIELARWLSRWLFFLSGLGNLSSIPGSYIAEGKKWLLSVILWLYT